MWSGGTLFGRSDLRAAIAERLAAGGGVALYGPPGIGRSALLDAVADDAATRGDLVLRLRPERAEQQVPWSAVADLVAQLPPEAAAALPPAQRAALSALRQALPPRAGSPALARRLVLPMLLAACARTRDVLLVLDDAQWLDQQSAGLIAFAVRRRPGPRVRVLAAERRPDPALYAALHGDPPRCPDAARRGEAPLGRDAVRRGEPLLGRDAALHGDSPYRRDAALPFDSAVRPGPFDPAVRPGPFDPAVRPGRAGARRAPARAVRLCPAPILELAVPPLGADDLTELLESRGLPCRTASRLHEASGGNPFLALALGAALPPGPQWRPAALPEPARALLRERLEALPPGAQETLTVAALAHEPTTGLLIRAGREDAPRELRLAEAAGLVALAGETVRFTPPILAEALTGDLDASARARVHDDLATAATEPIGVLWHRAMRSGRPDKGVARSLAAAAARAAGTQAAAVGGEPRAAVVVGGEAGAAVVVGGEARAAVVVGGEARAAVAVGGEVGAAGAAGIRAAVVGGEARAAAVAGGEVGAARAAGAQAGGRTAAELYLLAAARCPADIAPERRDWLLAAATTAASCGAPELAGRAAEAVLAADTPPGHRVRARLVLIDLAGQAMAEVAEMVAAALVEAGDDPALLAPVRLRRTWAAMIGGDPDAAEAEAERTVGDARRAGDPTIEAMALGALAQVQRMRGEECWPLTLRRALALPAEQVPGWLHMGPRYLAARFAMIDDRLDEARDELLRLLAVAEGDHSGEALVEVLRSLSEVATRAARCREALRYAHRAVEAAQRAGLSPGPTWYTAAVAELAGGSLTAAAGYARRGVRASEQEGDSIYLRRNLHALGQAGLRSGDTRAGVAALRRLRDLEDGIEDPMIVRWHGDLAGGLAALGEHEEAAETLSAARAAAHRLGSTPGMVGYLDRASAVVLSERGQADTAVILSAAAALHFEQLRQPIEQAHALLVQGGAERRRRRYAAARVAIGAALAIFLAAEARPWTEQTERALARTEGAPAEFGLTSTEARIAGLVRDGASNREIATQLYLSVKTIEATLTRVYRKLGVRSRTQLASRLQGFSLIR